MDTPIHDEADLDRASGMLTAADVGLNSLLVLDAEILSHWAEQRGDQATALRLRQRGSALAAKVRDHLWDDERKVFANRLWNGRFVRSRRPAPLPLGSAPRASTALARRSAQVRRLRRLPSVRATTAYPTIYYAVGSGRRSTR
jgi:hypothetical protein